MISSPTDVIWLHLLVACLQGFGITINDPASFAALPEAKDAVKEADWERKADGSKWLGCGKQSLQV